MSLNGKTCVITGGASGIGRAVARRFATAGAKVIVADLNEDGAHEVAAEIGGVAVRCDVTQEADIQKVVEFAIQNIGFPDLFFSNAGLVRGEPGHAASATNADWQLNWDVHVMSHVYAARAVLPGMIERGSGYLLQMASAAGLLNQIGDAAYSTTKHAAIGFAESLAITHGDDGVNVSVVCPQYTATALLDMDDETKAAGNLITAADAADAIFEGVSKDRFMILTHPDVAKYTQMKHADYDRWISGMRMLRHSFLDGSETGDLKEFHKFI